MKDEAILATKATGLIIALAFMCCAPILAWAYLAWPWAVLSTIVWLWVLLFTSSVADKFI